VGDPDRRYPEGDNSPRPCVSPHPRPEAVGPDRRYTTGGLYPPLPPCVRQGPVGADGTQATVSRGGLYPPLPPCVRQGPGTRRGGWDPSDSIPGGPIPSPPSVCEAGTRQVTSTSIFCTGTQEALRIRLPCARLCRESQFCETGVIHEEDPAPASSREPDQGVTHPFDQRFHWAGKALA
jgi:hypothetical protein